MWYVSAFAAPLAKQSVRPALARASALILFRSTLTTSLFDWIVTLPTPLGSVATTPLFPVVGGGTTSVVGCSRVESFFSSLAHAKIVAPQCSAILFIAKHA